MTFRGRGYNPLPDFLSGYTIDSIYILGRSRKTTLLVPGKSRPNRRHRGLLYDPGSPRIRIWKAL